MKNKCDTRRAFLRDVCYGASACFLAGQAFGAGDESVNREPGSRPNVVILFTDDQGSWDVNCYGSTDLRTPNLDSLAQHGTRFTQFYVGAPICSPSRAALLTGRYPQRAELDNNASGGSGMPGHQVTIAEMLRAEGYATGIFGKWHLGINPEMSPLAQGFDEFFGHKEGCIDNYSHYFYWNGPNRHDLWRDDDEHWEEGEFFPDMVVREAHRFIEANRERPFFLYVPFNLPHYPLQAEGKHREMYEGMEEPRKSYAAFVSSVDERIGQVVNKIDELGLRENTIIIFMSDNGHSVEERTFGGGGNAGPYRGHKFTLYEGGVRMPCIVSWPGRIPEGEVRGQMAASMDWLPTIAHYCGAELPDRKLDGANIAGIIESPSAESPHKVLHWQVGTQWAVREGGWKLVVNGPATKDGGKDYPAEKVFLSNLEKDVSESRNLAGDHPKVVQRLTRLHEEWAAEVRNQ